MRIEVECKLIAPSARALQGLEDALRKCCRQVRKTGVETVRDRYYDTADWRLYKAGFACRVRRMRNGERLGLKGFANWDTTLSIRPEIESPLPPSMSRKFWERRNRAGRALRRIAQGERLRLLFSVRNRRTGFDVRFARDLAAHVTADDFRVRAAGKELRLAEVEVEMISGSRSALRSLTRMLSRRLGLSAGTRTKFGQGLKLGGHFPPASRIKQPPL